MIEFLENENLEINIGEELYEDDNVLYKISSVSFEEFVFMMDPNPDPIPYFSEIIEETVE